MNQRIHKRRTPRLHGCDCGTCRAINALVAIVMLTLVVALATVLTWPAVLRLDSPIGTFARDALVLWSCGAS